MAWLRPDQLGGGVGTRERAGRRVHREPDRSAARRIRTAFFDAVYAISIWSHFAEGAALRWLDEMHRLIRPGGHLVLTSHGRHTIRFYGWVGAYPSAKLQEMSDALETSGYWYEAVFGEKGDSGVVNDRVGPQCIHAGMAR